jgi:hypothetical protein
MLKFVCWLPVGILFMIGIIAPIGFLTWIPAAIIAGILWAGGMRSPRFAFPFVSGLGLTLIGLGLIHDKYIFMVFYGTVLLSAGIVGYAAFGPRTSHADGPETFE